MLCELPLCSGSARARTQYEHSPPHNDPSSIPIVQFDYKPNAIKTIHRRHQEYFLVVWIDSEHFLKILQGTIELFQYQVGLISLSIAWLK